MLRAESVSIIFFFFFFFFTKPILKVKASVRSRQFPLIGTFDYYFNRFSPIFLVNHFFFFEVEICDIAKSPEKFDIQRQLRRNNAPDVKDKSFRQQG